MSNKVQKYNRDEFLFPTVITKNVGYAEELLESSTLRCLKCRKKAGIYNILNCTKCNVVWHSKCIGFDTLSYDKAYNCPRCSKRFILF